MKYAIGLAAALIVGSAALTTPVLAQSGSGAQMTGSNATGVQPEGRMSGKMAGGGGQMKSKKMKSKKNRM